MALVPVAGGERVGSGWVMEGGRAGCMVGVWLFLPRSQEAEPKKKSEKLFVALRHMSRRMGKSKSVSENTHLRSRLIWKLH